MTSTKILSPLILAKVAEQVERADRLIALVPPDLLEWRPAPDAFRLCDLLGHLLECLAGFCATLYVIDKDRLAHFTRLRELEVNHCCGISEARSRMRDYMNCIEEGFAVMTDTDLALNVPTLFSSEGEAVMTLLMGNLEHLINHKYQLFFYLKLMGVAVATPDLYHLRG